MHTSPCSRYMAHYILQTTHNTLHTSHWTQHTTHYIFFTAHNTLHTSHCTQHTSHFSLYTAHCTLHTAHCALHTGHCTLHTSHFTLHTAHFWELAGGESCQNTDGAAVTVKQSGCHCTLCSVYIETVQNTSNCVGLPLWCCCISADWQLWSLFQPPAGFLTGF